MIEKTLSAHQYDGLIVDHMPFNSIKVGDLIVFNPVGHHATVISKVIQIMNDPNSGESIKTNDSVDPISKQNYIGKVMYVIHGLGAGVNDLAEVADR